jgi:hypothetical protein
LPPVSKYFLQSWFFPAARCRSYESLYRKNVYERIFILEIGSNYQPVVTYKYCVAWKLWNNLF